jgi:hypothetical protein
MTNLHRFACAARRENYKDPESTPFGVGRGPLVRDAKKMGQPSRLVRFGNEATSIIKQGNTVGKQNAVSKKQSVVCRLQLWDCFTQVACVEAVRAFRKCMVCATGM